MSSGAASSVHNLAFRPKRIKGPDGTALEAPTAPVIPSHRQSELSGRNPNAQENDEASVMTENPQTSGQMSVGSQAFIPQPASFDRILGRAPKRMRTTAGHSGDEYREYIDSQKLQVVCAEPVFSPNVSVASLPRKRKIDVVDEVADPRTEAGEHTIETAKPTTEAGQHTMETAKPTTETGEHTTYTAEHAEDASPIAIHFRIVFKREHTGRYMEGNCFVPVRDAPSYDDLLAHIYHEQAAELIDFLEMQRVRLYLPSKIWPHGLIMPAMREISSGMKRRQGAAVWKSFLKECQKHGKGLAKEAAMKEIEKEVAAKAQPEDVPQ